MSAAAQRKFKEKLKSKGLCQWCYKAPTTKTLCPDCSEKRKITERNRRERLKSEGLCIRCSQPRGESSSIVYCSACNIKTKAQESIRAKTQTVGRAVRRITKLREEIEELEAWLKNYHGNKQRI